MKTKNLLFAMSLTVAFYSCRDKEKYIFDSPYINVSSPSRNQVVEDRDSLVVTATIAGTKSAVVSYEIWMSNKEKAYVLYLKKDCDSTNQKSLNIRESFSCDIPETTDVLLHVDAILADGTSLNEEVPFKLADSKN
jgi:hypothetical protein